MEWVGCIRCEKFQNDFMAQTCTLIAPVQLVLQRVSCSNETLQNATKHYETHENMSLRSNGVDRFLHCEKFRCNFMARTCALIAPVQPVLHRVSCSNETLPNAPNTTKSPKQEFRVQWGGLGAFVAKNSNATQWHKLVH